MARKSGLNEFVGNAAQVIDQAIQSVHDTQRNRSFHMGLDWREQHASETQGLAQYEIQQMRDEDVRYQLGVFVEQVVNLGGDFVEGVMSAIHSAAQQR